MSERQEQPSVPERMISKLAREIAQLSAEKAMLEVQVEDLQARLAAAGDRERSGDEGTPAVDG